MDKQDSEVLCRYCRTYSRMDRVFCLGCGRRLVPLSPQDISQDDFTCPGDRSNLDALRGTEPIPHLVERLVVPSGDRSESWLARYGARVAPPSRLDALIRACGEVLGLERLPRTYVAPIEQVNAFTTGRDDEPFLVIGSPALKLLSYVEMEGIVAHELAHVKSRHVLYHTLAESVANGAQVVAPMLGAGLVAMPIRMLLLSWYRESETSADRAALLVLGNYPAFESLMASLMMYNTPSGGVGGSLAELLQTHPTFERRLRLAREYLGSNDYRRARAKMIAVAASGSLASMCKHCSVMIPRTEAFCPNCGLSCT